jgi:hypothetical protein
MSTTELSALQQLKISCMAQGIRICPEAADQISRHGEIPLTIHEYATTGGVTLRLPDHIYINAPFDDWWVQDPEAALMTGPEPNTYHVIFRGEAFPSEVLPLPGYLGARDADGHRAVDSVMSHADRIRISPIHGCAFGCKFCDSARRRYIRRPLQQLMDAYAIARADTELPAHHALISGGSPSPRDVGYLDAVYEHIIRNSPLPVDVMFTQRPDDIVERLANWGIYGYSINMEIYDPELAAQIMPQKHRHSLKVLAQNLERALGCVGGGGRVRSLVLVGLEPEQSLLQGVEFLARLGCDPVLSPFRPANGTPLSHVRPPDAEQLQRIYLNAMEITERYGVKLGPRCIPCQHNTLTFPDGSSAYYYS